MNIDRWHREYVAVKDAIKALGPIEPGATVLRQMHDDLAEKISRHMMREFREEREANQ